MAAGRNLLLGNLPGVPHVGHLRAPLLQRAVGRLPARVPCLGVERMGLAPRRARRIARVGGRRRIDEVANGGGVQNVGAAIKVDQVRQGHGRGRDELTSPQETTTGQNCSTAATLRVPATTKSQKFGSRPFTSSHLL